MAQKNRADLQIVIDTNLPDNTTDLITPVGHREVEEDLKDSNFNKLDDTAFDVNYTPTTPLDWDATVPTETGGALDILIKKTLTNTSDNIAYVSINGSDTVGEFEIGNPLKPFLTINAAITAVSANGIVKVLGGVYTEDIEIDKSNIVLDIQSVTVTGKINITNFTTNISVIAYNSVFNYTGTQPTVRQNTTSQTINFYGGVYNSFGASSTVISAGAKFYDSKFNQVTSSSSFGLASLSCNNSSNFYNCVITSSGNTGVVSNCENNKFYNCDITSNSIYGFLQLSSNIGTPDYLYNCKIKGDSNAFFSGATAGRQCSLISYNTDFESVTGVGIRIFDDIDVLLIDGGSIKGFTDCISLASIDRLAGTNNILKDVRLYAGSGLIINEVSYDPTDLGVFNLQNNMLNKVLTYSSKVIDNGNNSVIVGLQQF